MKIFTSILLVLLLIFFAAPVGAEVKQQGESDLSSIKNEAKFVPDEIIVRYKNDVKPFKVIKVPAGSVKIKVAEYSHRPDIVYAEPNYYAQAFIVPNDQYYKYQWNLSNPSNGGIGMEAAWGISTGAGVTVAIIDTGISYEDYSNYVTAPDLIETTFVAGYDFVNKDSHANDDNGHGTHVAGTVAQSTDNNEGVAGVAYGATLMPIKVLDSNGNGSYSNIAYGIRYAADNGAKVINMSLGGSLPSSTLKNALAYAYSKGVTIVAAAGNNGSSKFSYPAAYNDYVIAVGATRLDRSLAYYSNYGTGLDLVAPGGDVNVDQNEDGYGDGILQNTFDTNPKDIADFGYLFYQGTSMASPHVAGVAALLLSHGNATTPEQVRAALQETAVDLGSGGYDTTYGWGLINAEAALNWGKVVNTAPVAVDDMITVAKNSKEYLINVLANDTDIDGNPLIVSAVSAANIGTVNIGPGGADVWYTPFTDYIGTDSFTYTISDSHGGFDTAAVNITVTDIGAMPTLTVTVTTESKTAGKNTFVLANASVSTGIEGATVSGHWEGATADVDTGVTDTNGYVLLQSDQLRNPKDSLTFTFHVDKVTKGDVIYDIGSPSGTVTY